MGVFDFFKSNKKKCKCGVKIDIDDNYCASCVKEISDKLNADIAERRKKRESRQLKEDFKTAKIKETNFTKIVHKVKGIEGIKIYDGTNALKNANENGYGLDALKFVPLLF